MNQELTVLYITAASIGFLHTIFGPDHYLPFIVMSRARNWSLPKTGLITFLCGIGHIMSSILLGAVGIILGIGVTKLEAFEGFRDSWLDRWSRVEFADVPIGLPAADYDGKQYSAIVYGRGPLFIDALAEKMGQEVFNNFLRDYYESNKWGIGTASNFRELAENYCDCDLTALFEEWVY